MIAKRITQPLLESGQLTLTERECSALTLPEHSSSIDLELEGEPFHAQWSGRSRQLTGDVLTERLQDYGQDGGLLRLRLVDQVYRLQLLPPGTASQLTVAPPPAPITTRAKATKTKRRATVDRQFHADTEYDWGTGGTKTIGFLAAAKELLGDQLKAAGVDPLELVELRLQGEELATLDDFEELLAVDVANVDRMPHQESVARHALSRLRGRAVLADEVGLGKTIEAGLAVKELALRGLAKRVLILCPAPLREQWRDEMNQKFDLAFDIAYRGPEIKQQDKLILSLTLGRSNADQLTKKPWDVVIIDFSSRIHPVRHVRQHGEMRLCHTPRRYCSRHPMGVTEYRPVEGGGCTRERWSTSSRPRTTRTIHRASRYSTPAPPRSTLAVTAG